MDKKKLSFVKTCCVGIGLIKKGELRPLRIIGSGFFVNPQGYVMTADHVVNLCELEIQNLKKNKNIDAEIAIFHVIKKDNFMHFSTIHYLTEWRLAIPPIRGYPGPQEPDIGLIIPKESVNTMPFLEIKTEQEMRKIFPYDDICICSYPGGEQSLDTTGKFGLRLTPLIQFGRISGFLPTDEVLYPYALQTDVIGTGGSSGSPILDPKDAKVVGISLQVIVSDILGMASRVSLNADTQKESIFISGTAKIGLVYGLSAYHFMEIPQKVKECREKGIPIVKVNFKSTKFHYLNSYSKKQS